MISNPPQALCEGNLGDVLEFWSDRCPDRVVYSFLDHHSGSRSLTLAELSAEAAGIAACLADAIPQGSRALLLFPPGLHFISAFCGCINAGVIAVPTCYPRPHRPMPRLSLIARSCQASVILSTRQVLDQIDFGDDETLAGLPKIAVDEAPWGGQHRAEVNRNEVAFLQYTSGSTSDPKGVMVSHANILSNLEAIRRGFRLPFQINEQEARGVFWLPAFHDMGLIGAILSPLYIGGQSHLMSPQAFLHRPLRWLEAMSRHRATISGAPNFAFELCVNKTTPEQRAGLDLASWELAFCGSEPIRAQTLERFASAFSASGFRRDALYPCYGLAETTLLASGGEGPAAPRLKRVLRNELWHNRAVQAERRDDDEVQTLVSLGRPAHGHEIVIVDPASGREVPEGEVGEVWIDGPSKALGYWDRPEDTLQTFAACLNGHPQRFLRTGDLGFVYEGEIYITGRHKEVMIIRGKNLYAHDVELTVSRASEELGADAGAAFSIDIDGTEQLCVAHELARRLHAGPHDELVDRIRRAVRHEHEVDPCRVILLRNRGIPRTSSGKIRRRQCRAEYLAGALNVLYEYRREDQRHASSKFGPSIGSLRNLPVEQLSEKIEEWLVEWLACRADVPRGEIGLEKPFAEYGLDSMTAVELSQELGDWLGMELSAVLAWNYPTIEKLARYLAAQTSSGTVPREVATSSPQGASADQFEQLLAEVESLSDDDVERFGSSYPE